LHQLVAHHIDLETPGPGRVFSSLAERNRLSLRIVYCDLGQNIRAPLNTSPPRQLWHTVQASKPTSAKSRPVLVSVRHTYARQPIRKGPLSLPWSRFTADLTRSSRAVRPPFPDPHQNISLSKSRHIHPGHACSNHLDRQAHSVSVDIPRASSHVPHHASPSSGKTLRSPSGCWTSAPGQADIHPSVSAFSANRHSTAPS
jgi:hypothetical protein